MNKEYEAMQAQLMKMKAAPLPLKISPAEALISELTKLIIQTAQQVEDHKARISNLEKGQTNGNR